MKIKFDIDIFNIIKLELSNGDSQPTLFASRIKSSLLYSFPMLITLILSIIGLKRKNRFRKIGFALSILTMVYLIIPVGIILATMV